MQTRSTSAALAKTKLQSTTGVSSCMIEKRPKVHTSRSLVRVESPLLAPWSSPVVDRLTQNISRNTEALRRWDRLWRRHRAAYRGPRQRQAQRFRWEQLSSAGWSPVKQVGQRCQVPVVCQCRCTGRGSRSGRSSSRSRSGIAKLSELIGFLPLTPVHVHVTSKCLRSTKAPPAETACIRARWPLPTAGGVLCKSTNLPRIIVIIVGHSAQALAPCVAASAGWRRGSPTRKRRPPLPLIGLLHRYVSRHRRNFYHNC